MKERLHSILEPTWAKVRQMRDAVGRAMADYPEHVRDATVMATSELLENAIKYGEPTPDSPAIELTLRTDSKRVELSVSNRCSEPKLPKELTAHIERLEVSSNKRAVFLNRMEALMKDPDVHATQLGLCRIGYEGEFDLECSYENGIVTVRAGRSIK